VLGGGGVLGEAWMTGVLAGIEDATGFDLRDCEHFVGTSAGSIVAVQLASGQHPRRPSAPADEDTAPSADRPPETLLAAAARGAAHRAGQVAFAASATLAPLALTAVRPGGAIMRAAVLNRIPRPSGSLDDLRHSIERSGARFDGRLRIATVDRRSGRRVVFGGPSAPDATVAQAVEASCAVPWLFAPVVINGREYVDGGVWSPSNLDVAPAHRGSHVLCLNPLSTAGGSRTRPIRRSLVTSALAMESLALRGRGAEVLTVSPDPDAVAAIGPDLMNRRPRAEVLAAGYQQGRTLASSGWVVRAR
jgi:NTE family protein